MPFRSPFQLLRVAAGQRVKLLTLVNAKLLNQPIATAVMQGLQSHPDQRRGTLPEITRDGQVLPTPNRH